MYCRSGTGRALLHRWWEDAVCVLTRWQHSFAWNDIMTAILKLWC